MERPWLRNYPPGVPAEIDPTQYPTLVAMFEESFRNHRDKDAFICMNRAMTYREVDEASRAEIEDAIKAVRDALTSEDVGQITAAKDALNASLDRKSVV